MENQIDQAEVSTQQEEEVLETSNEETYEESSDDDSSELQAELEKTRELANNYKIRAEKAERFAKQKPSESPKLSGDLSTKDLYALMDAKVPEEDVEVVQKYAKLENISIGEALKSNIVKGILGDKAEQRKVASASNVGTTRRSSKLSDEMLLDNARKGKLGNLSDDDIIRLASLKG